MKHKDVYKLYSQEKRPKMKESLAETYRMEITLYEASKRYLDGVMNGKMTLPIKTWEAERKRLTAEKNGLYQEYNLLKNEVLEIAKIRLRVYDIASQLNIT